MARKKAAKKAGASGRKSKASVRKKVTQRRAAKAKEDDNLRELTPEQAQGLLAEHSQLRAEMLYNDKVCMIANAIVLLTTAYFTFWGMTSRVFWVFLFPMLICGAVYLYVSHKRLGSLLRSSYIRALLEPRLGDLLWESRLSAFAGRSRSAFVYMIPNHDMPLIELILYNIVVFFSGLSFVVFAVLTKHDVIVLLPICLWLLFVAFSWVVFQDMVIKGEDSKDMDALWKKTLEPEPEPEQKESSIILPS